MRLLSEVTATLNTSEMVEEYEGSEPVSARDFEKAGFVRSGEFFTKGDFLIWICEDEDRLDRYFYNGNRIRTKSDLKNQLP